MDKGFNRECLLLGACKCLETKMKLKWRGDKSSAMFVWTDPTLQLLAQCYLITLFLHTWHPDDFCLAYHSLLQSISSAKYRKGIFLKTCILNWAVMAIRTVRGFVLNYNCDYIKYSNSINEIYRLFQDVTFSGHIFSDIFTHVTIVLYCLAWQTFTVLIVVFVLSKYKTIHKQYILMVFLMHKNAISSWQRNCPKYSLYVMNVLFVIIYLITFLHLSEPGASCLSQLHTSK